METILHIVWDYLLNVLGTSASQLFILLGPGLLLAVILYYVSGSLRKLAYNIFNNRFWTYFTAIGVVVHELGHAIFDLIFLHRIIEFKPFTPDDPSSLGHVLSTYDPNNLYQRIGNFFIGIGPILLGSIVIYFSSGFLMGAGIFAPIRELSFSTSTLTSIGGLMEFIRQVYHSAGQVLVAIIQPENLTRWQFYLFLYIIIAVGANMELSPSDLKGAWDGFLTLILAVLVLNLLTLWFHDIASLYIPLISQSYSFFYGIMVFTILLNLVFILIFLGIFLIKKLFRR